MTRSVLSIVLASSALLPSCTLCKPLVSAVTGPVLVFDQDIDMGSFFRDLPCHSEGALLGFGAFWLLSGPICGLVNGAINDFYLLTGRVDFAGYQRNALDPFATALDPERY